MTAVFRSQNALLSDDLNVASRFDVHWPCGVFQEEAPWRAVGLSTFVGSLNLADSSSLPENLVAWIPRERYTVYVIGIQAGEMTEAALSAGLQVRLPHAQTFDRLAISR